MSDAPGKKSVALFFWTPALAVGVEVIDRQHQELIRRLNLLVDGFLCLRSPEEIRGVMDFLDVYVNEHFGSEERLMRDASYPHLEDHMAEHAILYRELAGLKKKLADEGVSPTLAGQVNRFLVGWFIDHIGKWDRALGGFLKAHPDPLDEI